MNIYMKIKRISQKIKIVSFHSKNSRKTEKEIPRKVILNAIKGDYDSLQEVVRFYGSYIDTYSKVAFRDENGYVTYEVDADIKQELELTLLTSITRFVPPESKVS